MTTATLLERLDQVRQTGRGRWLARCPAHADKRPSLSVRELDDGRVLVHDFAGCSVDDVLAAVGLDFDALFPPKSIGHAKPERRPFNASDALAALTHEAMIVMLCAADVAAGKPANRERLLLAVERIGNAIHHDEARRG